MALINTLAFLARHPLTRRHKLQALRRFLAWQLGSRLVPGAVVVDWVQGAKFLARPGDAGLTGNIYAGLHEFAEMAYLLHVLRSEDLFIDVGANLGSYTLLACAALGARGYAFEPVPSNYQGLLANLRLNALENRVCCRNQALGAEPGQVLFTDYGSTMDRVLAAGDTTARTRSVEMTTLDQALQGEAPTLIKVDVEGYETAVLAGAQATLAQPSLHTVILELSGNDRYYGVDESQLRESLLKLGFQAYAYDPFTRTLTSLAQQPLPPGNILFIRAEALVRDRLRQAPKFTIHGQAL